MILNFLLITTIIIMISGHFFNDLLLSKTMKKILILCTGNSCRSQMAEGFLKQEAGLEVYSAGTKPKAHIDQNAVIVMKEIGIDISRQRTNEVSDFLEDSFDFVITVCDDARESCPIFSGKVDKKLHFGFIDPAGKELAIFRKVRDEIDRQMQRFIDSYQLVKKSEL